MFICLRPPGVGKNESVVFFVYLWGQIRRPRKMHSSHSSLRAKTTFVIFIFHFCSMAIFLNFHKDNITRTTLSDFFKSENLISTDINCVLGGRFYLNVLTYRNIFSVTNTCVNLSEEVDKFRCNSRLIRKIYIARFLAIPLG